MTDEVHVKISNHNRYLVKSLMHASRVLEAFQSAGDVLRLRDVVTRTGFNKGMCFRLLYTLHQCGFLDKVGENHYRLASEVRRRRIYRIGYAAQGQDTSFDREVRDGLVRAAEREHVELIVVDNRYQPKIALRSADYLIKEQVDLVIEFQTDELIASAIATKYLEANIPFIAIDIPHPGATYFGANNYQAGLMAVHHLGRWAKKHWNSEPDEILLVELRRAGECVIVGQNAEPEARAQLRSANTRLIASVAFFPEKYGDGLLKLALDILSRKAVPPAVFTTHQIITPENVDHFYPNDSLLATPA